MHRLWNIKQNEDSLSEDSALAYCFRISTFWCCEKSFVSKYAAGFHTIKGPQIYESSILWMQFAESQTILPNLAWTLLVRLDTIKDFCKSHVKAKLSLCKIKACLSKLLILQEMRTHWLSSGLNYTLDGRNLLR